MNLVRIGLVPFDDLFLLRAAPTALTQIMGEILFLIVAGGFYTQRQAFVTLDPDPWPSLSGPFVSIHPGSHSLIRDQWHGAGANLAGYGGEVKVRIADQCMLDHQGQDDRALLRADAGLVDRAQQLAEFLTGEVANATILETGLLQTPLRPGKISDPGYRRGDKRWRTITLGIEFQWTHTYIRGNG